MVHPVLVHDSIVEMVMVHLLVHEWIVDIVLVMTVDKIVHDAVDYDIVLRENYPIMNNKML